MLTLLSKYVGLYKVTDLNVKLNIEWLSPSNFLLLNKIEEDIFVSRTDMLKHGLCTFDAAGCIHG